MIMPRCHKSVRKRILCFSTALSFAFSGTTLSTLALSAMAQPPADEQMASLSVNMPAQSLDKDIRDLAHQAGLTISFSRRALKKYKRPPVNGQYNSAESLNLLLQGTPYSFEFVNADTVRIFKKRKAKHLLHPARRRPMHPPAPLPPRPERVTPIIRSNDEIIVTANKRNRFDLLQSAPYSASVVSGQTIRQLGTLDTQALSLYIPGVEMTNLGSSRNKMSIRGISDGVFNGRIQSTVGVYFNDTPINFNAPYPDIPLLDIKSVEVLRGPQGSLYGAGSIGGIYKITTNKPDMRGREAWIETSLSTTKHGGFNSELSTMVNLPLYKDKLAVRGVGYLIRNSGYIDDVRLGIDDTNKTSIKGGRATLAWQIDPDWQMEAGVNYQDVETDDTQYRLANLPGLQRENYVREPHGDDYLHTHINFTGYFPWGHIKSTTSRVTRNINNQFDASLSLPDNIGRPVQPASFTEYRRIDFISHETVFDLDISDNINLLVGGFVSHTSNMYRSDYGILAQGVVPRETLFSEARDDSTLHYGAFGEADINLTNDLVLGLGVRWFDEHLTTNTVVDDIGKAPVNITGDKKDNDVLPRISLGYQFTEDSFLYALLSTGYRVGGLNTGSLLNSFAPVDTNPETGDEARLSTFQSDVITMYELGEKTRWFDGRLTVNASAFYVDWKNIQTEHILDKGFSSVLNAGNATNLGYDFELIWKPDARFNLQANATINNPDITNINPVLSGVAKDKHLPRVPDFSASVMASYTHKFPGTNWQAVWTADYAYTGSSQLSFAPSDALFQGENHALNARVNFSNATWQIEAYINNILDDKSNTFAFGNPFTFRRQNQSTPMRPRTIGLRMRRQF